MASLLNLNLNLLVLFDALYRKRHLSAAGAAVGLSQPAASQALARLRDALGDPLFVRRGNRMEPTAVADSLAPAVRDSLRLLEDKLDTLSAFDASVSEREFTIGLGEVGEMFFFANLLAAITRAAPRVRLRSVSTGSVDVQTATVRGDLDLGFDFEPVTHPMLRQVSLGTEELVVIARHDHPRAVEPLTMEGYLNEARVRVELPEHRWRRLLSVIGAPFPELTGSGAVVGFVSHVVSVPSVVAETDALAIVPLAVACLPAFAGRLRILAPPIPLNPLPIFACWHERHEADQGHEWLRSFLTARFWER